MSSLQSSSSSSSSTSESSSSSLSSTTTTTSDLPVYGPLTLKETIAEAAENRRREYQRQLLERDRRLRRQAVVERRARLRQNVLGLLRNVEVHIPDPEEDDEWWERHLGPEPVVYEYAEDDYSALKLKRQGKLTTRETFRWTEPLVVVPEGGRDKCCVCLDDDVADRICYAMCGELSRDFIRNVPIVGFKLRILSQR
uniref:Uncharacterized protein n=1 Tax=Meloidogyne javanica TaxID=6303 RepID=A0A915M1H1_MELJA